MKIKKILSLALMLCLVLSLSVSAHAGFYGNILADEEIEITPDDTVVSNEGCVVNRGGSVLTNYGTVHNYLGNVDRNDKGLTYPGFVYNYEDGTVNDNRKTVYNYGGLVVVNRGGSVYNFGGTIRENTGTVIEFYPLSIIHIDEAGVGINEISEGDIVFHMDPYGNLWLRENYGGILAEPSSGYTLEISGDCRWEKQSDGSFVISNVLGPVSIKLVPVPKSPVPATGDMSNMPLWALLFLGFAAIAIATRKKKA